MDGDEPVVDAEGKREKAGGGLAVIGSLLKIRHSYRFVAVIIQILIPGSQAWVRRADTGNLASGRRVGQRPDCHTFLCKF